jgi:hypothetical protein
LKWMPAAAPAPAPAAQAAAAVPAAAPATPEAATLTAAGAAADAAGRVGVAESADSTTSSSSDDSDDSDADSEDERRPANANGAISSASFACVLSAVAQLPLLAHLELQQLPLQQAQTVQRLAAAPALTHLSIKCCDLMNSCVRALAPCIGRLTALLLDGNRLLTTADLRPPRLVQLSLAGVVYDPASLGRLSCLIAGDQLRQEAKQSLLENLGVQLNSNEVQNIVGAGPVILKLQDLAAALQVKHPGLEFDLGDLLEAVLEASAEHADMEVE